MRGAQLVDGRLPGVGLGLNRASGPVTVNYDDRPMRFDQDLARVSAPDKVIPKLPITVVAQSTVTLPVGGKPLPLPGPPDLKKLSQALIALAMAQAEAEAQSEHENQQEKRTERRSA